MSDTPGWTVTISNERPEALVMKELRAASVQTSHVLGEIGVITGHAPAHAVAAMRREEGVADVSPELAVDIGPPDGGVS